MDYGDYSEWNSWLNQVQFGEIARAESEKFRFPLDIAYCNGDFFHFLKHNGSSVEGIEVQERLLQAADDCGILPAHGSLNETSQRRSEILGNTAAQLKKAA